MNIYRVQRKHQEKMIMDDEPWGVILTAKNRRDARKVIEADIHASRLLRYEEELIWDHIGMTTQEFADPIILLYDIHYSVYPE